MCQPISGLYNIRILKVEYDGQSEGEHLEKGIIWYQYDADGKVTESLTEIISYGIDIKKTKTAFNYDHNKIKINNNIYNLMCWNWVELDVIGKEVTSILVNTSYTGPTVYTSDGRVDIIRDNNGRVSSIMMIPTAANQSSTYMPLTTNNFEYNQQNLPNSSTSIDRYKDGMGFGPFPMLENESDVFPGQFTFAFEYSAAQGVPNQLKRLVNEELLFLNRYGVFNFDEYKLAGLETSFPIYSINGEGNWLISFGLPQYHILEDKSTHMVSQRTTKHYKINDAGEQEFIKSTVEEFPYIHDADAKTLEIAGLKIWYEFVD